MSDLRKSFVKTHLVRRPPNPPPIFDERDEQEGEEDEEDGDDDDADADAKLRDASADDSSSSSASSTGTIRPSPSKNLFQRAQGSTNPKARSAPLPWEDFFAQELFIPRQEGHLRINHHVYLTSPTSSGPLFVTHHGAGSSGLSFATVSAEIRKVLPHAGILSLDARGHGTTSLHHLNDQQPDHDAKVDLTLDTLSSDLAFVVHATQTEMKWPSLQDIVLLGHSLGGAVVTHVAFQRLLGPTLLGYAVLDVVEGSALDALQSMETYLLSRPNSFASLTSAVEWHIRSRTIRSALSARVSVPPLLLQHDSNKPYTWRTDLGATKPFWENWFIGLSKKFLEARGGKLLLLAGTDRLDRELMIGQMQGKYQLVVFPEAGHFVHEDQPAKSAQVLVDFYRRNDRSALVLPPKVGAGVKPAAPVLPPAAGGLAPQNAKGSGPI